MAATSAGMEGEVGCPGPNMLSTGKAGRHRPGRENRGERAKDVYPIGKKTPTLPFHPAVRAGDFIFVSGQVAKDEHGNMISGTIEVETAGTIESIRRILAEEGASLADVVRVTTYLEDTRAFGRYNKVFAEHL